MLRTALRCGVRGCSSRPVHLESPTRRRTTKLPLLALRPQRARAEARDRGEEERSEGPITPVSTVGEPMFTVQNEGSGVQRC